MTGNLRLILCFNPRPHARGDDQLQKEKVGWEVSIHAPTRGATPCLVRESIYDHWFQSTPPREGRRIGIILGGEYWAVSIHAPTRGATV